MFVSKFAQIDSRNARRIDQYHFARYRFVCRTERDRRFERDDLFIRGFDADRTQLFQIPRRHFQLGQYDLYAVRIDNGGSSHIFDDAVAHRAAVAKNSVGYVYDISRQANRLAVQAIDLSADFEFDPRTDTGVNRLLDGARIGDDHDRALRLLSDQLVQNKCTVAGRSGANIIADIGKDRRMSSAGDGSRDGFG